MQGLISGSAPVTTSRREPRRRIAQHDRVLHLDGREGLVLGILDETNQALVRFGSSEPELVFMGYLQRIVGENLSA